MFYTLLKLLIKILQSKFNVDGTDETRTRNFRRDRAVL